ncbi:hypothetical protein T12_15578 [Trichinella patagoniensis]|uniref:Uncharacterized protein n=1 Tax=Trichinella patagoniensis TaxID=990121 RepID=A0A0V1A8V1_9BILA|nr:hypothetical protein T12_15578 [Trichinella patagoniensis]
MLFEKAITVENPCNASFVLCSSRFEYHKYCGVSLTVIRTNTSNKQASSGATNAIGHFCSFPHNSGKVIIKDNVFPRPMNICNRLPQAPR